MLKPPASETVLDGPEAWNPPGVCARSSPCREHWSSNDYPPAWKASSVTFADDRLCWSHTGEGTVTCEEQGWNMNPASERKPAGGVNNTCS